MQQDASMVLHFTLKQVLYECLHLGCIPVFRLMLCTLLWPCVACLGRALVDILAKHVGANDAAISPRIFLCILSA